VNGKYILVIPPPFFGCGAMIIEAPSTKNKRLLILHSKHVLDHM